VQALKARTERQTQPPLYAVPDRIERRRVMPNRIAYALVAGVIGLGLFASITPSPLYHAYSLLWHFSPLTLTLIYATYAFGVLASLLLVGGVSDDVGRRPVLLVALGGLMAAAVLFMVADSEAWLFVARGIQGLATGAALSAASAALLDLHPRRPEVPGSPTVRRRLPGSASTSSSHPRWSGSAGSRAFCRTPCCWSSPRSRSPARSGCPSSCASGRAFA
jgi:MFS family permease